MEKTEHLSSQRSAFAEVGHSQLDSITGLCWPDAPMPHYGMAIQVDSGPYKLFGVITQITTSSLDETRTPHAFQKKPEDLAREHPQIFAFIQTTINAQLICYQDKALTLPLLPPVPAPLHSWISPLDPEVARMILTKPQFFKRLIAGAEDPDSLILAMINSLKASSKIRTQDIASIAQCHSEFVRDDYYRTTHFVAQLEELFAE